jgi:hypothetical protein
MGYQSRDNGTGASGTGLVKVRRRISELNVAALNRRVAELETEMQEARRLNRRVAELLDIVEELLVPLSLRDEDKVREYVDRHSTTL